MRNDDIGNLVISNVKSFSQDLQIAGVLLDAKKSLTSRRPKYFYLTDLVNPQQAFWDIIEKMPEKSEDLRKLLEYGTLMHNRAGYVLSQLPGFSGSEGVLDGAEVDLPGIRGRADFRFGDSLVEFKTTIFNVDTPEQVWENTPQDVEQILFYASLWTLETPTHYLIFYTEDKAQPLRVYKITIKNHKIIKNILRQRRDALRKAIESDDPSRLKKCRYHNLHCPVREGELCLCHELDDWSMDVIKEYTELEKDTEMEKNVSEAWRTIEENQPRPIRQWDLIIPRKTYGWLTGTKLEEPWQPEEKFWVWKALKNSEILPGPLVTPSLPQIERHFLFRSSGIFINRKMTDGMEVQIKVTPTLIRRWRKDYVPKIHYKGLQSYIIQLGILCALVEKPTGALILEAPKLKDDIFSFLIQFNNLNDIKKKVVSGLEDIATAVEKNEMDALPKCPKWMIEEGFCEDCGLCEEDDDKKE